MENLDSFPNINKIKGNEWKCCKTATGTKWWKEYSRQKKKTHKNYQGHYQLLIEIEIGDLGEQI